MKIKEKDAVSLFVKDLRGIQQQRPHQTLVSIYEQLLIDTPRAKEWAALADRAAALPDHARGVMSVVLEAMSAHTTYHAVALSSPRLVPILRKLDARDATKDSNP